MINVIEGKLLYMKMVKGETDPVYVRLHNKFMVLVNSILSMNNTNAKGTSFIKTYKLSDFEKENSYSSLTIDYKEDGKPFAHFISGDKQQNVSVDSKLKADDLIQKDKLAISLCRGIDKKTFWLLHKRNKNNLPPQRPVDIDILIDDLDSLLKT